MKQTTIAWAAIFIFLVGFASPFFTGNAIASPLDFSIKSVVYPSVKADMPFIANITFSNSGSISATYARYKYEILGRFGNVVYSYSDYVGVFPAKGDVLITTPAYVTIPAGKYKIKIAIDSDNAFDELDETNNVWEEDLTIK